jgi:membrane-associated protein
MSEGLLQSLIGGLLAFAEAMLGVGIVLPGEVMITGIASATDGAWRPALFLTVTLGATTGDHVNYWLGAQLGSRLPGSRIVARIGVHH